MKLIAKVTLEHSDGRSAHKPQTSNNVLVELCYSENRFAPPNLFIAIKPKELCIPIAAPCTLYGHLVNQGRLGLRFNKFKLNPWDVDGKILQLNIQTTEIEALVKIRNAINLTLTRGVPAKRAPQNQPPAIPTRRPLVSFSSRQLPTNNTGSMYATNSSSGTFSIAGAPQNSASAAESRESGGDEELPPLSREQQRALQMVLGGKSIFFTGSAGTGKSLLLRHIIRALPRETTFVTGTTGLAGCLLGGTTINSFAGIGRGEGNEEALIRSACRGESGQRWRRVTTLIIDEISMMDGKVFDLLDKTARAARGIDRPFGGIQLVLSGDFHQLPPVARGREGMAQRQFCFESEAWKEAVDACVSLTRVFRQEDDEFVDILGSIREGSCAASTLRDLIDRCSRPLDLEDGILPTQLYTHRADVDTINAEQLNNLPGDITTCKSHDVGDANSLAAACPARATLDLRIGAQVMLIKNIDSGKGLVNGARGVVERFTPTGLPVVKFAALEKPMTVSRERWNINVGGRTIAQRTQFPLALAWAVTVHKSQGLTLDRVEVNLDKAFECGMAYVALSRVKSLEGLRIIGSINPAALKADAKVTEFYRLIATMMQRAK